MPIGTSNLVVKQRLICKPRDGCLKINAQLDFSHRVCVCHRNISRPSECTAQLSVLGWKDARDSQCLSINRRRPQWAVLHICRATEPSWQPFSVSHATITQPCPSGAASDRKAVCGTIRGVSLPSPSPFWFRTASWGEQTTTERFYCHFNCRCVIAYRVRGGEHHGWLQRVTFPFVLETEAPSFQHTTHWPGLLSLTLNSHRNMSLVPAELRIKCTSAIVHDVTSCSPVIICRSSVKGRTMSIRWTFWYLPAAS